MSYFDQVHAWTYSEKPPVHLDPAGVRDWKANLLNCRMALRQARRFVLTDDFVRQVVRRATVPAPKMLNLCHLANAPFEKLWVEFSNNVRIDTQHEIGTGESRENEERGITAFLIERRKPEEPGLFLVSHAGEISGDNGQAVRFDAMPFGPVAFGVDLRGLIKPAWYNSEASTKALELSERLTGMGWGYFQRGTDGELHYVTTEELNKRGTVTIEPRFMGTLIRCVERDKPSKRSELLAEYFSKDIVEGRGNLRFVIALLAMLNTCPIDYHHRAAKGYHRARLRNVPYLDSHELTIHCGRRKIVNVVDEAIRDRLGGWHNQRHEVRGFWRNAEYGIGARGCAHEAVERDGNYAMCGKCERLLVWVDHHERGDAALGFVHHDYLVKT